MTKPPTDVKKLDICKNMVLEFRLGGGGSETKRVLFQYPNKGPVVLQEIFSKTAREHSVPYKEVIDAMAAGSAIPIDDPFLYLRNSNYAYSDKRKEERDRRVYALRNYLSATSEVRFDYKQRAAIIREISSGTRHTREYLSKSVVYDLIRRFHQRGQIENAFLSDRDLAGYTDDRRRSNPPTKKEGTNRGGKHNKHMTEAQKRAGVILTPQQCDELYPTIKDAWEKPEQKGKGKGKTTGRKRKWKDVLEIVCKEHYCAHIERIGGKEVRIPKPKSQCPTIAQLTNIYESRANFVQALISREGQSAFNKIHRASRGDTRDLATGPMKLVQIDFTVADIYLRHRKSGRLMGRPTITLIVDTFSRLIVGFAVGWRRESWATAVLAILNMVTNKVEYCRSLGFDIEPHMWPSSGDFCEIMLSDNGALIAYLSEHFHESIGLQAENTPSDRPDLKAVVESAFKSLNEELIYKLDGAILRAKTFRDMRAAAKKARAESLYDLQEFTAMVAEHCVRQNSRVIKDYPISDDMLGKVAPIPIKLYSWGVQNQDGSPEQISVDLMRIHCLSRGTAVVREDGIYFARKTFTCKRAEDGGWFVIAKANGRWDIDVLYDKRNLEVIYLPSPAKKGQQAKDLLERCTRLRTEGDKVDISEWELDELLTNQKILVQEETEDELQKAARFTAALEGYRARAKAAQVRTGLQLEETTPHDMRVLQHQELAKENARVHDPFVNTEEKASRRSSPFLVPNDSALLQTGDYAYLNTLMPQKENRDEQ